MSDDLSRLRSALNDRSIQLITHALGRSPNRNLSTRNEARWGAKGSFCLQLKGRKRGLWYDHEAGEGGDLFDLIRSRIVRNGSFPEVITWARGFVGDAEFNISLQVLDADEHRRAIKKTDPSQDAEVVNKQRRALAIWDRATAPESTPVAQYIRDVRKIPIQTWPEAVRFDPLQQTLVLKATDDNGSFAGIQRIYLTSDGQNVKDDANGRNMKRSMGPIGDAAVRLPGPLSGPLLIAEGPETGLSIWCATGHETWIALGSTSKIHPPAGRHVVICHDDDPRTVTGGAWRATQKAKRLWLDGGLTVSEAWPWEIGRADRSDFNDVIKAAGAEALRERIQLATNPPKIEHLHWSSLEEASSHCSNAVAAFFGAASQWHHEREGAERGECTPLERAVLLSAPPPTHAIRLTVGGGKTEASLRLIVDELLRLRKVGDSRAIVFAVPQHNLSREIAERFEALAHGTPLKAATWRGREAQAPDATGQKMCRNIELAHEAAALWADMEKEVCPTCPYYHGCRYLAQRELDGDLWIVAHQMVFHQMPGPIDNRGVYALIIDESFWRSGLFGLDDGHRLEVALDELAPFRLPIPGGNGPNSGEHLADLRDRLRHACADEPDGPINRQMLLDHGFESNSADMASRLEYRRKDKQPTWQERKENRSLRRLIALWDTIREFLASEGDEVSGRLTVVMRPGPNGTQFRAIRITGRHSILDKWRVPTLLIDANFDPDLIHFYFPRLDKITDIDVASPNMRVQQATDRAFGKSALFRGGKPNTPTLRRLRAFILREARKTDREMLVVANKAVLQELHLPSGIHTAHFNALAGRDEWRFVSKIIILGRPQPSPSSVEAIAGALTGRASITLGQNWYPRSDAYRLLAIGNDPSTAAMHYCRTDRHVDETVEKIRRQIAEGEMVQAVGRGRGVQRTEKNPLDVLILTDLVLPIPLTSVFSSREATNPDTATLMLAEGGIAYEDAAAASKAYPQLWNTPAAARQALRRQRCVTLPYRDLNGSCHRPPGTISVVYQQAGSGRHAARAFVDPQIVTDPKSVIEGVFGQLVRFEVLGDEIEAPASGLNPPETYPRLSEKASRAVALFQAHSELLVFTVAGIEPKKQNCLRQSATHLIRAWATELIEFGWEPDTVFGRPDSDRCPHGLVHFLGGEKVRAIGPEHAVTDTGRIYDRMAA